MLNSLGIFKDHTDETIKQVFTTEMHEIIEISSLANKNTIDVYCVPTHHYCNLGCKMCHLTNQAINKKMLKISSDNLLAAIKIITFKNNSICSSKKERRSNNTSLLLSFMGVGEPLLNWELIRSIYLQESEMQQQTGYQNFSYALSTMMPNSNLKAITQDVLELKLPLKIHFSLHTPFDSERKKLLPATNVDIKTALQMLCDYRDAVKKEACILENLSQFHTSPSPIEIHYTLIKGINDSDKHLNELLKLSQKYMIPIKFILFNPINQLQESPNLERWIATLKKALPSLDIIAYAPPGREIGSSCGEFTKHYYHEKIETKEQKEQFEIWKKTHEIENYNAK